MTTKIDRAGMIIILTIVFMMVFAFNLASPANASSRGGNRNNNKIEQQKKDKEAKDRKDKEEKDRKDKVNKDREEKEWREREDKYKGSRCNDGDNGGIGNSPINDPPTVPEFGELTGIVTLLSSGSLFLFLKKRG
jgi:hypothetical protein